MKQLANFLNIFLAIFCLCNGGRDLLVSSEKAFFVSSTDSLKLSLSSVKNNVLRGRPGDLVSLDFVIRNDGLSGYFSFE